MSLTNQDEYKKCISCHVFYAPTKEFFYTCKGKLKFSDCKSCKKLKNKLASKKYREKHGHYYNPEKANEKAKRAYEKDKAKAHQKTKEYYMKNKERITERLRAYAKLKREAKALGITLPKKKLGRPKKN